MISDIYDKNHFMEIHPTAMIVQVAPDIAGVMSHYGFPFSRVPLAYILKCKLKNMIPLSVLNKRQRLLLLRQKDCADKISFEKFCSQSNTIREILMALKDFFPESDWSKALLHYAQRRVTIFTGSFLRTFSGKIRG